MFRQLVVDHQPAVRRFVQRRAPAASVDDIVQEVFLVVWRRIDHIMDDVPENSRTGWLCAVARRAWSRDMHRGITDARRRSAAVLDRARTPITTVSPVDNQRLLRVSAALERLSSADADLLMAYYWDRLDGPGLATYLDISEDAARQRLSRALKRLRQHVEEVGDGLV